MKMRNRFFVAACVLGVSMATYVVPGYAYHSIGPHPELAIAVPPNNSTPVYFSCSGTRANTYNGVVAPFECKWDFGDPFSGGSGYTATGVNASHTYSVGGSYVVKMAACDVKTCNVMQQAFTVNAPSPPCNARVNPRGPYSGVVGQGILFKADSSGCTNAYYVWNFGDGTISSGKKQSDKGVEDRHIYQSAGTYTVTLAVYVNDVQSGNSVTTTATVSPPPPVNQRPTANPGGPYTGMVGVPITFDGSASYDPEGSPLTYRWQFGDGGQHLCMQQVCSPSAVHQYSAEGIYTVTLFVNDGVAESVAATSTVTVTPNTSWLPPILQILFD